MVNGHWVAQYTVEVYKNYQFNPTHPGIPIPHTGQSISISQADLAHLNTVGLAHDFHISIGKGVDDPEVGQP